MTTPFGTPFELRAPRSIVSTIIVDPTLGYDVSHSPLNLAHGATPNSDNYTMREGRLEVRPALSRITDIAGNSSPAFPGNQAPFIPSQPDMPRVAGGAEVTNVLGQRYLMISATGFLLDGAGLGTHEGQLVWMQPSTTSWTGRAGYVGPNTRLPALGAADFYDWTQIFYDQAVDNIAVGATTNRQGLFAWVPSENSFSYLTGSPGAKCVCAFDNYLLAGNTEESGAIFVQRVRWSDRGSASSWTGGLSGYEDLLSARGGVNRVLPLENRVIVFFDDETWTGSPIDFPSTFRFAPLDSAIGCPYPWTATNTPRGIVFMARNYQLYLLPKEGGTAQPIGKPIHRSIRAAITQAKQAFGVYDGVQNLYQFYYSSSDSEGVPRHAVWMDLDTGVWAPQSFISHAIKRGFTAQLSTDSVPTWDDMTTSWDNMNKSWDDMLGLGNERQTVVLLASHGTAYALRNVPSDDGKALTSYWESEGLGGEWPGEQKTVTRVDIDYTTDNGSALTVRAFSGRTFSTGTQVSFPASSSVSQMTAYLYDPSRYAAIRVESTGHAQHALHRFHVDMRIGGR